MCASQSFLLRSLLPIRSGERADDAADGADHARSEGRERGPEPQHLQRQPRRGERNPFSWTIFEGDWRLESPASDAVSSRVLEVHIMRFLARVAIALGAMTLPAGAQGLPTLHTTFTVKVEEHGNFLGRYIPELPTQALVAALETGCIAFGVECSAVAESLVGAARQTVFKRNDSDINHVLSVFPPPGYDTCRARANMSYASISGGTSPVELPSNPLKEEDNSQGRKSGAATPPPLPLEWTARQPPTSQRAAPGSPLGR
jgi:hypothetical protein